MQKNILGFTLLELVVVLAVVSLLATLGVPSIQRYYEAMEYRGAVRELSSAVNKARQQAFVRGVPIDLLIDHTANRYCLTSSQNGVAESDFSALPETLAITVTYAAEVSSIPGMPAIRFYPSGGSSGGEVSIERQTGAGVTIEIDWLLGVATETAL